eukprot:TRINITY_DN8533_c0_g2_i4.p1 TRINITY_DN8533_c0_g2~~TRINITY_DN8533_c0_g2_i4.p1  ORF type:complete len:809 (+),score=175.26 TRINITY_DN8533_c0_g2_i4:65-2428(+)
MGFFDWIGFTAAGIQSFFSWATFNRDGFVDNVQMRQNQMYQKKNYQISWTAIARDDIRDMMGISVNRINNYMLVATLILGVAASAVLGVSFEESCPDYLVYSFYLCVCISIVYLMLAIMFGVKGQNCAFTNTMKLLTAKIRPENPADYNHDYMKQAQWIERNGLLSLFRIPGVNPYYDTMHEKLVKEGKRGPAKPFSTGRHHGEQTAVGVDEMAGAVSPAGVCLEAATPLESLFKTSSHLWYLTKFNRFMELWKPYDNYSKFCMGLGIICLGQGSAYFSLGRLVTEGRSLTYSAACIVTTGFVYMVVLVTTQNFKTKHPPVRFAVNVVLMAGPLFAAAAAVTLDVWVDRILVPLSFLSHFAFWLGAFSMAQRQEDVSQQEKLDWLNKTKSKGEPALAVAAAEAASASQASAEFWRQGGGSGAFHAAHDEEDAGADHWPTDDKEFEERSARTSFHIKRSVRQTLFMSAFLWGCMFVWSVVRFIRYAEADESTLGDESGGGGSTAAILGLDAPGRPLLSAGGEQVAITWPSPLFRPSRVACAGGSVFFADRFSVFELTNGAVTRVDCGELDSPIADVAAFCNGLRCAPILLLSSLGALASDRHSRVVDCATGNTSTLFYDESSAEHLAIRAERPGQPLEAQQILVGHSSGDFVQYAWRSRRHGWEPEAYLGKVHSAGATPDASAPAPPPFRGFDVSVGDGGGRLLLFWGVGASGLAGSRGRNGPTGKPIAVDARDLATMERSRAWAVADSIGPLQDGCATNGGFAAYVLRDQGPAPDGTAPALLQLRLT